MGYSNATITTKGQELMTKVLAGESKITFSKMATSEKSYEEFESKQSVIPSIDKDLVDNTCRVRCIGIYSNASLTTGYYINTIVLYAKGDDGVEIAFSYIETDGTGKYMEAYNSQHPQSIQFTIYTGLTVNDSSSVIIDPEGVATIKYVDNQIDNIAKRITCDYIEESETTLNTNHPASKDELGKTAYVKDSNTVYKCIYDESTGTYKWVVDSSTDKVVIASKECVVEKNTETLTSAKAYSDTNLATAKTYTDNNIPKLYNGSTSSKIANSKGVIIVNTTSAPSTSTCPLGYGYETYS